MDDLAVIEQRPKRGRQTFGRNLVGAQDDERAISGAFAGAQGQTGTGLQDWYCPRGKSLFMRLTLAAMIRSSGQNSVRSRP